MRENKAVTWTEVEDIPPSVRPPTHAVSDSQQLPAIRNTDGRPGHVSPNSASLPPIPRKKHIQAYVPPQQRPKLTSLMTNHRGERPIHNLMGRYMEPHPPEVKHQAEETTDKVSTAGDMKRINRFIKTTSVIKTEVTNNHTPMTDVVITEANKGLNYSVQSRESSDQEKVKELKKASIDASVTPKTSKALTGAIHARPKTSFRSIIQCPDAPLLPGRREPIEPHPPLEPYDSRPHRNVHGNMRMEHGMGNIEMNGDEGLTKLPFISKDNNVVACHPPAAPRLNGGPRRRWKAATMKKEF